MVLSLTLSTPSRIRAIRDGLSFNTPLWAFIQKLKASVNIDSRTMLGGDIQRCLLSNAAHRLEILGLRIDPTASWRRTGFARLREAWDVFHGRAVAIYVKEPDHE